MTNKSHIAGAIAELEAEREHLAARLEKVDAAIAAVHEAFHLPTAPARVPKAKAKPAAAPTNGNGDRRMLTDEMIVSALKAGPLSPGALAKQLGIERARVRFRVSGLLQRGFLSASGETASRLLQLTAKAAKEAP